MATLTVGTGQQYTTIAAAVAATQDGDTVLVQAGTYLNDFFDVTHKITLQSVGGLAIIDATVAVPNGKGIAVVDNDVTIDGFGFTGSTVDDANGAGIRYDGGNMVVRNSVFWNNQNGILANADPTGTILIQNSEFSHNGAGDGYTHNLYVGVIASLTIEDSYFHDAVVGHEIKSRALSTTITGNRIQDNANGTASYSIDLPDGGVAVVENNTIEKGPNASNVFSLHFGGEGTPYANSALTVSDNTLISDNPAGVLLLNQTNTAVALTGNQIYGYTAAQIAKGPVVQTDNTTLATEPKLDLTTIAPVVLPPAAIPPPADPSIGTKLESFGPAGDVVASGRILTVGAHGSYGSLQSALAGSQDGDTIEVAAGTYVNDFGVVNHKVIIEGVGGLAHFIQQNDPFQTAGILVVNTDVTLKNMEFSGTADYNGFSAGVDVNAGNVTIDNSFIHDNEIGIKTADNPNTTLSIYNTEIGPNGNNARDTSNVLVGSIESLTMQDDYIHGSFSGHEITDHAFNTDIENSRIIDGAGVAASFLLDLGAGGNATIENNLLVKGPSAVNGILVHVGGEGTPYSNSNVQLSGNTMVSQVANYWHPYTDFIVGDSSTALVPITASNNVFIGGVAGSQQLVNATGTGNTTATSAPIDTSAPWSAALAPALFAPTAGTDTLTLQLAEDRGDNDAQFLVTLDGSGIGGGVVTAANGGVGQQFTIDGSWGVGPHQIAITMLNPQASSGGGAHTLYVQSMALDGTVISPNQAVGANTVYTATLTGRTSLPDFNASYYLAHDPVAVAAAADPVAQYISQGASATSNPDSWFDASYYLQHNPDVAAAGMNPLYHFETFGWMEGRDPSLTFSDSKYLAANPDVKAAGVEPLEHYLAHGQFEGRATFLTGGTAAADPAVNASFYDKQLGATLIPTGTAGAQQAASGYDTAGWQKGLNPDAWFNTNYYLSHNPDVAAAHMDPLLHYETYGWKEGRNPSADFSTNKYLGVNSDVKAAGMDPLLHFISYGQAEGRQSISV